MKIKKPLVFIGILAGLVSLSGCSLIWNIIDDVVDDGERSNNNSGADFDVDKVDVDGKTIIQQTYKDYSKANVYNIDYCPSSGDVKMLIIPVWFSDSNKYITITKKDSLKEQIRKAYLGSNEETGWRSVKTYYEELSQGALSISGTISDWYSTSVSSNIAGSENFDTAGLVKTAVDWYFTNNPSDNKADYDSDNNGYLDAVMLIYGAPDYSALGNNGLSNLWAYAYWVQEPNETTEPIPNVYFWASYDFLFSSGAEALLMVGTSYGSGDTTHCLVDAHTYIHEMGHVFGLDDYYDYGPNGYRPAGGFSMQDWNIGCHDPFSAMALGWANPYVVQESAEVEIGTFQKTRDLVLLTNKWNNLGSPFDEYFLLELYSPTGLNEMDCKYTYDNLIKGPSNVGIRLWHVDARLAICVGVANDEPMFSSDKITNTTKAKDTLVYQAFTNSFDDGDYGSVFGERYYNHNLLQLIRRNTKEKIQTENTITNEDLFSNGSYALEQYRSQFVNSAPFKMNNGGFASWNIKIEISGSGHDAKAKLSIVK